VIFTPRTDEVPLPLRSRRAATSRARATRFFGRTQASRAQESFAFDSEVYAAPAVLTQLRTMFNDKCAYCESPPGQSQVASVDHFRPRAGALDVDGAYHADHYWWLAYEWTNLLLVCPDCSRRKGARFPVTGPRARQRESGGRLGNEKAQILDPCSDDPEAHFVYGEDGFVSSGTEAGKTTIEVLALNRWWLTLARADALRSARATWEKAAGDIEKANSKGDRLIMRLMDPVEPYAGIRRQFTRSWLSDTGGSVEARAVAEGWVREGSVVDEQQQELTREAFEHFEESVKSYTVAVEQTDKADSYYITTRTIRRVEIRNFRTLRSLDFDFPESKDTTTPWLMLLGENGRGKSSVLQAVALALMGDEYRTALGIDPRRLVTWGEQDGSVIVRLTGASEPVVLTFNRDSPEFRCHPSEPKILLMAYGATRLLPRPKRADNDARVTRRDGTRFANVDNLFDPFIALNDPVEWLAQLDDARFATVARALKGLLPLGRSDRFLRDASGIHVEAFGNTLLTLDQLSDGYQSVLALATDMMQVLIHRWSSVKVAEGIVIIDELEAHLHPSWRMRIIGSLREVFPRLQFLTTTHDPLCLRGLEDDEVMVMGRDASNRVFAVADLPSVKGLRVDQLLTSEIFGLDSTSDPEIDALLAEYRDLRWRRKASASTRRRQIALRERLDELQLLGRDLRERLVLEAADQYLATEPDIADPGERRALKRSTKRRIAEIFAGAADTETRRR
jgi:uncharacterized protein (TIGR02646 family)